MTHPQDVEPAGLKLDPIYDALWELCAALANEGPPKTPRAHTAWKAGRSACLERLKADADRIASPSPSGDVREAVARLIGSYPTHDDDRGPDNEVLIELFPVTPGEDMPGETFLYALTDQIAALYVERIGVGVSQSQPCTDGAQPVLTDGPRSDG